MVCIVDLWKIYYSHCHSYTWFIKVCTYLCFLDFDSPTNVKSYSLLFVFGTGEFLSILLMAMTWNLVFVHCDPAFSLWDLCVLYSDVFSSRFSLIEKTCLLVGRHRWVEYASKDRYNASQVPPEWHGWLHYITDHTGDEVCPLHSKFYDAYRSHNVM